MNTIDGAFLRASSNSLRIRAAPRPANISTNAEALCAKKRAPDSFATAFAASVFPVPGGPWKRMPFGTRAPSCSKRFGSRRKSTISWSSSFASSSPATSPHVTEEAEPGVISCGLTRGISRTVFQSSHTTTHIRPKKRTGSQVRAKSLAVDPKLNPRTIASLIGRVARDLKAGEHLVDRGHPDPEPAPVGDAGGRTAGVEPARGLPHEGHRPAPGDEPADRRVVADVDRDPEQDDFLGIEQFEERVGVRIREDVEVLLEEQELTAAQPVAGDPGERQGYR